jgi:signal-transduction protein with cAMP-binding, CBS, and nucleotidyltransferase domain
MTDPVIKYEWPDGIPIKTDSDDIIEAVARALLALDEGSLETVSKITWENTTARQRKYYIEAAETALATATPLIEANALEREAYTIRERTTAAVTPVIRAAALEEAVVAAKERERRERDNDGESVYIEACRDIAAAIRALKEQP